MLASESVTLSDAAIASIVTGVVTITLAIIGYLNLLAKLKYGVEKAEEAATKAKQVEDKIDDNTTLTKEGIKAVATNAKVAAENASDAKDAASDAKDVASDISSRLNGALECRIAVAVQGHEVVQDHTNRIAALEEKVQVIKLTLDSVAKSVDSTRHELRGHLQTITNQLSIMAVSSNKQSESK